MTLFQNDLQFLLKKYNIDRSTSNSIIGLLEENNNKTVDTQNLCIAKTKNGGQCSRKKKNTEYCGIHQQRFKSNLNEPVEKNNYIETWIDEELGPDYLIDSNNYVYTYNIQSPIIIGIKCPNGKIKPFNLIGKK